MDNFTYTGYNPGHKNTARLGGGGYRVMAADWECVMDC